MCSRAVLLRRGHQSTKLAFPRASFWKKSFASLIIFFYFSCNFVERVAISWCSFVIDDPMRDLTCLLLKVFNSKSKRWPFVIRCVKRGIRGLFLGGRAPLGCGKTQNMCVCSEFSQHPILKFCLRLPKNNIPSGFLV